MRELEDDPTGPDRLVQRFIDQELSGEERVQLLLRLGRDRELRERALDLERLVLEAGRLPKADVPTDFVARVMDRVTPRPSVWRRLIEMLWAPHTLQWNLAGAAATALALIVVTTLVMRERSGPASGSTSEHAAAVRASATISATPVLVRLVVVQPDAKTVALAGDFNGWDPMRTPLDQASGGAWTVTIPLEPGRYEYMFVVNGERWISDPLAVEENDDGFGSRNAVLDVRVPKEASL